MAQAQRQPPSSTKKRERSRKGFVEGPLLPTPTAPPKKTPTESWDSLKSQEFTTPPCDPVGQPATGSLGGKRSKLLQQKRIQSGTILAPLFDPEDDTAQPKRAVQALFVSDDSGSNTTSPRALTPGKATLHLGDVQFSPAKPLAPQTVVKPKQESKNTPPQPARRLNIDLTSEDNSRASIRLPLGSFGDRESFSLRRGSMNFGNERESISISRGPRESSKFDNLDFHEYDYHEDVNNVIHEEDVDCMTPSQQAKTFDWETHGSRSPSSTQNDMLRSPVSSYRGALRSPRMSMTEDYGSPRSSRFSCSFRRETPLGPKLVERQRSGSLLSLVPESDAFLEKEHLQQCPQTVIKKKKGREPPPTPLPHRLSRQNSLYDDKLLFLSLQALKLDGWGENRSNPVADPNDDNQGRIFATEFTHHRQVGSGAFFDVFRVEQKRNGKMYAIKRSKRAFRSKKDRSEYLREIQMVSRLELHRNIITYYRAWQEELHFLIQMEYCHSNLSDFVNGRTLSERFLWDCFQQIAQGLSHVHKGGLIHLDIKPENILVELKGKGAVYKLGDFGQARLKDNWMDGSEGDSQYVAPELINDRTDATAAADVFSLGLLMFELSSRYTLPKNGELWRDLRSGKASQELPIAMEKIQCSNLKSLILRCLEPVPADRITADEIVAIASAHLTARAVAVAATH